LTRVISQPGCYKAAAYVLLLFYICLFFNDFGALALLVGRQEEHMAGKTE